MNGMVKVYDFSKAGQRIRELLNTTFNRLETLRVYLHAPLRNANAANCPKIAGNTGT